MAKKEFQAESKKLMDMMINSIYTNKEIFLRELISNASDAIDKLYYKSLTDTSVGMNKGDFRILLTRDKDSRTLTISDNGIGMTREELEQNLGTIAHSGSEEFKEANADKQGDAVDLKQVTKEQQFTQPPARYTEATLIRAMEEKGIGRPSTYAPTISTITSHDYVIKEGKYLKPTPLGRVVTGLMKEHFADIVDLKFTNQMEEELDGIENGKAQWRDVLADFYGDFSREMNEAEKAMDGVKLKVPDVLSDEYCDVCGRQMVVKKGRFGYFLACPGFPDCTFLGAGCSCYYFTQ